LDYINAYIIVSMNPTLPYLDELEFKLETSDLRLLESLFEITGNNM